EAQAEGLVPARALGEPDADLRLAFRYARPPVSAAFELRPRRPVVSADVLTLASVADDVLKVDAQVVYTILYAGIRELRIAVPAEITDEVEIEGPGLQEKRREEPGAPTGTALPGGPTATAVPGTPTPTAAVVWRVLLQSDVVGTYDLRVSWKRRLGDLAAGASASVPVSELRVLDVFTETGHIAVQKGDDLVVEPEASGLEAVDARELPPALRARGGIFRSYRFLRHPYALTLRVFKYEFAPVLDTMINAERLDAVVTRERVARCECVLDLQNNRRQFLEVHLPAGADLLAVYQDGQLVRPAIGASKEVALISLPKGRTGASSVKLVLRYDVALGERAVMGATGTLTVPAPTFPLPGGGSIPVGRSRFELYMPSGYHYLSFESAMQRRFPDRRLARTILSWIAPVPEWHVYTSEDMAGAPAMSGDALNVQLVRPPEARRFAFTALEAATEVDLRFMGPVLAYGLAALFFVGGLAGPIRLGRLFEGPGALLLLMAGLFVLSAFAGEAVGGFPDAALAGAAAVAVARAARYAVVDAPRARADNALRAMRELNAGADRREIEALKKEVAELKKKPEQAPPASPEPPAGGAA
ncbi:MAG TPA: hypothetical protein VHF22_13360, partial [Planctomycetota bacterium]|nr:hypothetical protein [Planctomycetota bacterium]